MKAEPATPFRPRGEVRPWRQCAPVVRFVVIYIVRSSIVSSRDDAPLADFLAVALDGFFGFGHRDYPDN